MADQLESIDALLDLYRRVKVIEMLEKGYSQSEIASLLNTSQSSISRMIPAKMVKRI